jgi:hypothetical protein
MPNHFHLQLTLDGRKTIEKGVGLVKGNFSYRSYIDNNPVKAGLADKPKNYPYGSAYFRGRKRAHRAHKVRGKADKSRWLKPTHKIAAQGSSEIRRIVNYPQRRQIMGSMRAARRAGI